MTHAQHTPGPWTYESDHTHRQYNIRMLGHQISTRYEAKHICTVNNLPPHILANRTPAIAEANARLIAAAPDLLAALQYVLDAHDYDGALTLGTAALSPAIRDRIKREIAKATGQDAP